ncbi:MAG: alkaline phosphatase, partial [Clostridia bacterium]|nr:alkaline phosphatase [Clostridia bacterium]
DVSDIYVFIHQRLDDCDNSRYLVKNAVEIRTLLQNSGKVRKVFQGHYHKGDFQKIEQIEYITLQAMCEGEKNIYTVIEI